MFPYFIDSRNIEQRQAKGRDPDILRWDLDRARIKPISVWGQIPLIAKEREMRAGRSAWLVGGMLLLLSGIAVAENATMHGVQLRREGKAIRMSNFDVTLDGRLLTAKDAVYHPDTGVVELTGNVQLRFGPSAREFPGEVK